MPTLNDSLPIDRNGIRYNPYQEIEAKFCHNFTNNISELKKQSQKRRKRLTPRPAAAGRGVLQFFPLRA